MFILNVGLGYKFVYHFRTDVRQPCCPCGGSALWIWMFFPFFHWLLSLNTDTFISVITTEIFLARWTQQYAVRFYVRDCLNFRSADYREKPVCLLCYFFVRFWESERFLFLYVPLDKVMLFLSHLESRLSIIIIIIIIFFLLKRSIEILRMYESWFLWETVKVLQMKA